MQELLQCTQCDTKWERERTRGRKPLICPSCFEINLKEGQTTFCSKAIKKELIKKELIKIEVDFKYPSVSYWFCPDCNQTLIVHVGLNHTPVHVCKAKRNMSIAMQETNRKELKEIAV